MSRRVRVGVLLGAWILLAAATLGYADCVDSGQLFTELSTDPATLAYATAYGGPITAGSAGNDQEVLAVINLPRAGVAYEIQRTLVPAWEVAAQMAPAELLALTQIKIQQLVSLFAPLQVDVSSQNIRDILFNCTAATCAGATSIFPNPGVTRTNLIAIVKRQGSRAELPAVCGRLLTLSDISFAIRGSR